MTRVFSISNGMEEIKPVELPIYCKLQQIGYGDKPAAVISGRTPRGFKCVTMSDYDTPHFFYVDNFIRPISKKFGIGTYYYDDFRTCEAAEVEKYIQLATEAEERANQAKEAARIKRDAAIVIGKKLFDENKPADAIGVIIAEFKKDESDPQSDYFHASVERTIILAFTNKKRDDFNEMRKAAANCPIPEINKFSIKPEKPADASEYWEAPDEHREKYSMGNGYYLGDYKNSNGINISKSTYVNLDNCPDLWAAAGEKDGFFAFKSEVKTEPKNYEKLEIEPGTVQVVDYSEKAIAVIGDTKPIKDKLKELGGKFNFRLSCGAGWIFPKTKLNDLQKLLGA